VFVVLGVYALAALGLAFREHADFAALFQGGALWQRLPRWLQGSFIGALLLLPASILVQVARLVGSVRRKQPVGVLLHQTTALVMSLVMALSGLLVPGVSLGRTTMTRPDGTTPPEVPPPTAEEFAQSGKALFGQKDAVAVGEEFVRAVEQELDRPGADPSDVGARAAALGRDAGKVFGFLRDQVALEPYAGVLRGARGTLAAGAGNALDRALLAQALLQAIGVESRLMSGKLSAGQADALLTRFFAAGVSPGVMAAGDRQTQKSSLDAAARDVAARAGVSPDGLAAVARRASQRADSFRWKADEQRAASLEFLAGQLRQVGVKAQGNGQAVLTMLRDRLKEHYWVQVKGPDGSWTEFDPTFPDALQGAASATDAVVVTKVPADRFHRFELKLVYRTKSGDEPRTEVLVERNVTSADALFEPLELRIQPGEAIPKAGALRKMDARQLAEMLRKFKRFQVLLRAGASVSGGRGFDLEGHTFEASGGPSSGSAAGLMGGTLGFGGEEEAAAFLDVQLVVGLSGPGREPVTQTRTIVRAADTKSPTFAPPIGEWQVLVQPQWISPELAGFEILSHVASLTKGLTEALKSKKGVAAVTPSPIPGQLLQLALLRQDATRGILAARQGLKAFIDEPLLTVSGHRLSALRPNDGRIVAERTIDIVENAVRFVAKDPQSQAPFEAALGQGVADCTFEQHLLQDAFPEVAATSGSTVFERARLEGRQPVLARPQDAAALRAAGLEDADVEWIGANEGAQSRLLIAKAQQGPAAWWSVRPDGTAVLRVSGGKGQALTEHAVLTYLKILGFLLCAVESADAILNSKTTLGAFTLLWCMAATAGSSVLFAMEAHLASWILLALEGAVMLGTQAEETWGEEE
jgi:transglutaminase-like putative cysteine protease